MRRLVGPRIISIGLASTLVLAGTMAPAGTWGHWFHREQGPPCTLAGVGALIDGAEREIRAAGTIVIKQPDVWGQDRMTAFRRDFDLRMRADLDRFQPVLSAQVARSDVAASLGQGAIGGVFGPIAPAPQPGGTPQDGGPAAASTTQVVVTAPAGVIAQQQGLTGAAGKLLDPGAAGGGPVVAAPGLPPGRGLLPPDAGINLEPAVVLDEKKQFLEHGYELLRVNLGDDTADAAGYGLYLFRMPVSIDPGGPTCKGWGGMLSVTVRHEFGGAFVPETFRSLVINDLVDLLSPIIVELIRSDGWRPRLFEFEQAAYRYRQSQYASPEEKARLVDCVQELKIPIAPMRLWKGTYPIASGDLTNVLLVESFYRIAAEVQDRLRTNRPRGSEVSSLLRQELEVAYELMRGHDGRSGPLADIGLIEGIVQQIEGRQFDGMQGDSPACLTPRGDPTSESNSLPPTYRALMGRLPGNLEQRALGSLCWAIAVDAGLLNRQLRQDMWRLGGTKAFVCPDNLERLFFYTPIPTPDTDAAFCDYVKARWPLVAFALDPVTDQQNVADAYHRSRDLQLALAGAFAAGRIGAHALTRLMREVRYDAEALTLNRTVTAFAHGPDTFGWRFYPRYQNPRADPSALHAFAGILAGGFDPYKTARLEPGQRELTAAIIVPSFLRSIRIETASNWFKLANPAALRLETARMLEQGRSVVMLRQGLAAACDADQYRPDDVARLSSRIDQLERMLPLQTHVLGLPYDHTLGGFELFTQGAMSLAPELVGYEGVEGIDPSRVTDLLLLGKHVSLSGTRVIISGVDVPEPAIDFISRRALRIRLPAGLPPTAAVSTGQSTAPAYEVFLITPGGTSNRLVIPCLVPPPPAAAEFAPDYSLGSNALEFVVEVDRVGTGPPRSISPRVEPEVKLRIVPQAPALAPPAVQVGIPLGVVKGKPMAAFRLPWPLQYDGESGGYTMRVHELRALADHIARALAAANLLDPAQTSIELAAGPIELTSVGATPAPRAASVAGTLRIVAKLKHNAGATKLTRPEPGKSSKDQPSSTGDRPDLAPIPPPPPNDSTIPLPTTAPAPSHFPRRPNHQRRPHGPTRPRPRRGPRARRRRPVAGRFVKHRSRPGRQHRQPSPAEVRPARTHREPGQSDRGSDQATGGSAISQ